MRKNNLSSRTSQLYKKKLTLYEMVEADEVDEFWNCFKEDEDYLSYATSMYIVLFRFEI